MVVTYVQTHLFVITIHDTELMYIFGINFGELESLKNMTSKPIWPPIEKHKNI